MASSPQLRRLAQATAPLGLVLISTAIGLLLVEAALRLVVNPGDLLLARVVEDPILGHRIEPHTSGHDALGFRNAAVPAGARIVAIGDSQTYGVSATRSESWPSQLSAMLGEPVYSMALGGYGPLEYLYLATRVAPPLQPRLLLVGFYFGNDLVEACRAAQQRPYWQGLRKKLNASECDPPDARATSAAPERRFGAARDWLSRHSVTYAIARNALSALSVGGGSDGDGRANADELLRWTDSAAGPARVLFTPRLRLAVLDPREPRIQDGLRMTKHAFAEMKKGADGAGSRLLVVLIPTKERVYCPYLQAAGVKLPQSFDTLCAREDAVKAELTAFFTAAGIAYVDAAPAMEAEVRRHVQIYPPSSDGHPRAAGYRAIAGAVREALQRLASP